MLISTIWRDTRLCDDITVVTDVCGVLTFGFGFLLFGGAGGRRAVLRRLLLRLLLGRLLFLLLLVILSVRTCWGWKRQDVIEGNLCKRSDSMPSGVISHDKPFGNWPFLVF